MTEDRRRFKVAAEIGSAVAVITSLVFVGLEVRETSRQTALNTESLQVTAYQHLIGQIGEFNQMMVDPDLAALYERLQDPEGEWSDFSVVDRRRAMSILFYLLRHADMAFYQFERGMLPEARMNSAAVLFLDGVSLPLYSTFWEDVRDNFVPSFREFVDHRVAESAR